MSPQQYFKTHGGRADVMSNSVTFYLPDDNIVDIPIDPSSNLPMIWNVGTTSREQAEIGPHLVGMASAIDDFGSNEVRNLNQASTLETICTKQASVFNACFPCVADETNQQLTGPQKELLLWHWKLGINMQHVQELMHD